jgi:4-amino-4-deoxy-L-arabinose transferase-like glycosyltransferase
MSQGIIAIPIFLFIAKIPGRRRTATKEPIPFFVGFLLLLQFLAGIYLVLNAVGWPTPPQLAPFAMALTVLLFTTGIAYLTALARALRGDRGQT